MKESAIELSPETFGQILNMDCIKMLIINIFNVNYCHLSLSIQINLVVDFYHFLSLLIICYYNGNGTVSVNKFFIRQESMQSLTVSTGIQRVSSATNQMHFIKRSIQNYQHLPKSGRPSKVTPRSDSTMLKKTTHSPRATAQVSVSMLNVNVHGSTISATIPGENIVAELRVAKLHLNKLQAFWKMSSGWTRPKCRGLSIMHSIMF